MSALAVSEQLPSKLLLDIMQQLATVQSTINVLIAGSGRAEEDRKAITAKLDTINGRISSLERFRAAFQGGAIVAKAGWGMLYALGGAGVAWIAHKTGLVP